MIRIKICISCILLAVLTAFPFQGNAATLDNIEGDNTSNKIAFDKLTEAQLLHLIDSIFELENVPTELINDLNKYIKLKNENRNTPVTITTELISIPDSKTIFINEMDSVAIDSSFSIAISAIEKSNFTLPIVGVITSKYGWRDNELHKGIDIDMNKGDTVRALMDGVVRFSKKHMGYGNVVIVSHSNGLETLYAHLSKLKVTVGQTVKAGELIGLGGNTGKSTGSHLHFETRFKGEAINPQFFVSFEEAKLLSDTFCVKKTKWGCTAYPENATFHVIKRGDNLFEIAKRYGTNKKKIKELNCMSRKSVLKVGQKIRIS